MQIQLGLSLRTRFEGQGHMFTNQSICGQNDVVLLASGKSFDCCCRLVAHLALVSSSSIWTADAGCKLSEHESCICAPNGCQMRLNFSLTDFEWAQVTGGDTILHLQRHACVFLSQHHDHARRVHAVLVYNLASETWCATRASAGMHWEERVNGTVGQVPQVQTAMPRHLLD